MPRVRQPQVGGAPLVSAHLSMKLAVRSDALVREIVAVFPKDKASAFYGDQRVTALRVMIGIAMHTAAQHGIMDALAAKRHASTPKPPPIPDLPRGNSVDPNGWDDEPTVRMRRPLPDLGDE